MNSNPGASVGGTEDVLKDSNQMHVGKNLIPKYKTSIINPYVCELLWDKITHNKDDR